MGREIKTDSKYEDVLVNLIPGELIAAYIAIDSIAASDPSIQRWVLLATCIIILILIPPYLMKLYNVKGRTQIIFTMFAFIIWVYCLGGPFKIWGIYNSVIGSVVLVLFTLIAPIFNLKPPEVIPGDNARFTPTLTKTENEKTFAVPELNNLIGKEGQVLNVNRFTRMANVEFEGKKHLVPLNNIQKIK
jgi:hypothetical protein